MFKSSKDSTYQDSVNGSEWENPANWWGGLLYHSPRDSRLLVPKRIPSNGETLNLGRPLGLAMLVAPLGLIAALIVAAMLGY